MNASDHPAYEIWRRIIRKCCDPTHSSYKYFGAKGIKICDSWHDFNKFMDDVGVRPKDYRLALINKRDGYFPGNCVWMPLGVVMHPLYQTWRAMKNRCTLPTATGFENYGGRGITITASWYNFYNFVKDMGPRPKGCTLDRVNNDGDYEPANCRWATRQQQNANKRLSYACYKGHLWSQENTIWEKRNGKPTTRRCKICREKNLKERREKGAK